MFCHTWYKNHPDNKIRGILAALVVNTGRDPSCSSKKTSPPRNYATGMSTPRSEDSSGTSKPPLRKPDGHECSSTPKVATSTSSRATPLATPSGRQSAAKASSQGLAVVPTSSAPKSVAVQKTQDRRSWFQAAVDSDREEKKRILRKERENISKTLFPNQDKVTEFEKDTGVKVDLVKLQRDAWFMDDWVKFTGIPPTDKKAAELISQLRKRAVNLHKKKPDSGSSGGKKRSRPSNEESPPFKQPPKVHKPAQEKEKEVEQALGNLSTEPSEKDIEEAAMEHGAGTSFAAAAAGKNKPRYDWILFVNGKNDERSPITRNSWDFVKEKFAHQLLELQVSEPEKCPRIEWMGFKNGTGLIACLNRESREATREIIDSISAGNEAFKGWGRGEASKYTKVHIDIPKELSRAKVTLIVGAFVNFNKLPADKFKIGGTKHHENRLSTLTLLAEDDFVEALRGNPELQLGGRFVQPRIVGKDGSAQ